MGKFAELYLNFELRTCPKEVHKIIEYLVNKANGGDCEQPPLPDHAFFQQDIWETLFYPWDEDMPVAIFKNDTLIVHSTVRLTGGGVRYSERIPEFLKWIEPHIHTYGLVGYFMPTGIDNIPELIFNNEGLEFSQVIPHGTRLQEWWK